MVTPKLMRSKNGRCLLVVLAALLFAGCGNQSLDQNAALMPTDATASSGYYLAQMQQSGNNNKPAWQLLAIHALLNEGNINEAAKLYFQLPTTLTEPQMQEAMLLGAQVKLAQKDIQGSIALLDKLNPYSLNARQQARYWPMQIAVRKNSPSLPLLRALVAQEPLLSGKAKQQNIDMTWQSLLGLTTQQMASMTINADENTLQGWLDLRQMWAENRGDANMLEAGIKEWQRRYPQNPGAKMLPTPLTRAQNALSGSISKIALLLPLSGQASTFGQIIQQGFDDARLHGTPDAAQNRPDAANDPGNNQVLPDDTSAIQPDAVAASPTTALVNDLIAADANAQRSDLSAQPAVDSTSAQATKAAAANPNIQVKVYDTASQPLEQILAQVQQEGASLVIGPLLKNNVEQLPNISSYLNILALNQPEQVQNRTNICYFALSPEDEAQDAARHIWQQGKHQPLLLLPSNDLGSRVARAFSSEWRKLGGGTLLAQRFGSVASLKAGINSNSGIALTGTPVDAPASSPASDNVLTQPMPVIESTSGSVDAVYIVATHDELALIKPMIAMCTGSQSAATLYASSRSAQGGNGADFRFEMEGLQFSDIPLLAGSNPVLLQQALQASHNNFALVRLYAMGNDAWTLANHFAQIRQEPGYQIEGNTGVLTADADCVITRKLTWLKFQKGKIVPAS